MPRRRPTQTEDTNSGYDYGEPSVQSSKSAPTMKPETTTSDRGVSDLPQHRWSTTQRPGSNELEPDPSEGSV